MHGNIAETVRKTSEHELLKLAVCSDLRKNILICLSGGKQPLSQVREILDISSTTAIHALRELEKNRLVSQEKDKNYALTSIGSTITLKLIDFNNAVEVLKTHERFWLEHDLSGIPEHMMEKIGWLKNSTLIEDTSTDIFKVHKNFIKLLSDARVIKGISSIYVPEFMQLFQELILNKNVDVELILTQDVLGKIDEEIIKKISLDKSHKLKLYITKEGTKAAFTVTDYFFSLGLFHVNGNYDYNRDLVSYDEKGIEWGKGLYEWYLQQAERISF